MSDTTRTELIAEAKNYEGDNGTARWPSLITDLAAALAEADRELGEAHAAAEVYTGLAKIATDHLAQQAATIEAVKALVPDGSALGEEIHRTLSRTDTTSAVVMIKAETLQEAAEAAKEYSWWGMAAFHWLEDRAAALSTETTTS